MTYKQFLKILIEIGGPFTPKLVADISSEEIARATNMRDHFGIDSSQEVVIIFHIEEKLDVTIFDPHRSGDEDAFTTAWEWFEAVKKSCTQAA